MAAGMGSRFGGLKQIEPLTPEGEILLDFSLYDAMMAGFEDVIFIIKRENEDAFRKLIDSRAGKYLRVRYAYQEQEDLPEGFTQPEGREKPWGTGHAVLSARNEVKGPFAVINADDYYGPSAFESIFSFLEWADMHSPMDLAMVGYELGKTVTENGTVSRGVCRMSEEDYLTDITERTKIALRESGPAYTEDGGETWTELPEDTVVSMNMWGFTSGMMAELEKQFPDRLREILEKDPLKGEYFLPAAVEKLIGDGRARVKVLRTRDKWYGITYREDKEDVSAALQSMKDKGLYPGKLWR